MPRGRVRFRHLFLFGRNGLAFAISMVVVMFIGIVALIVWHVRAEKGDRPYDEVIDNSLDEDDLWYSNVKVRQSYLDECERCDGAGVEAECDSDGVGSGRSGDGKRRGLEGGTGASDVADGDDGDGGHQESEDDAGAGDGAKVGESR